MDGWMDDWMHACMYVFFKNTHAHVYLYLLLFQFPCQIGLYHHFGQMENSSIFPNQHAVAINLPACLVTNASRPHSYLYPLSSIKPNNYIILSNLYTILYPFFNVQSLSISPKNMTSISLFPFNPWNRSTAPVTARGKPTGHPKLCPTEFGLRVARASSHPAGDSSRVELRRCLLNGDSWCLKWCLMVFWMAFWMVFWWWFMANG